jgi:hypothetical protein
LKNKIKGFEKIYKKAKTIEAKKVASSYALKFKPSTVETTSAVKKLYESIKS